MQQPSRFIDITLPLSDRLTVWPGDPPISIAREPGNPVVSRLSFGSHAGTHLDAPAHFLPGGATVEQLLLDGLIGPAWVAEIRGAAVITAALLERRASPRGSSGCSCAPAIRRRGEEVAAHAARPFNKKYVALDATAGSWLLARRIRLIGIDGPSIDPFGSPDHVVHNMLLANKMIIVENLALAGVQTGHSRLICLPLRYEGGDGLPSEPSSKSESDPLM